MKVELLLLAGAAFFVADTVYDNQYTKALTGYKKHLKVVSILFMTFSLYLFVKRNPNESKNLMGHLNGMIRYMPMDKNSKDMLAPFLGTASERRVQESGSGAMGGATARSVSGTKKKYVAAAQQWKCSMCHKQLDAWFEVDHKIRLADGGSNHISNLVALCRDCHGKKTTLENM
jgi:hypothetical protein